MTLTKQEIWEQLQDSARNNCALRNEIAHLKRELLSAQAAIEKAKSYDCNCPLHNTIFKNVDLSALREHESKVRKPLVDLLREAQERLGRTAFPSLWKRIDDALA